jgi:thioredoxin 1
MRTILLIALSVSIFGISCSGQPSNTKGLPEKASADQFKAIMDSLSDEIVLDVRTLGEVQGGMIEGAVHMDFNTSEFKQKALTLDKQKTILVYCLSGGRSSSAAAYLRDNGYANVVELGGGTLQWKNKGYALVSPNAPQSNEPKAKGMGMDEFNALIQKKKFVLVDFQAVWCKPCQMMKPEIQKLLKKYPELELMDVDVDENPEIANALEIQAIPKLHFYKNGELKDASMGFQTVDQLEQNWLKVR